MTTPNVQQLPPGLAGRVANATVAPAPSAPVAPAPVVPPVDLGPAVSNVQEPVPVPTAPVQEMPVNPMLSHLSQPQAQEPAPVVPPAPAPAPAPQVPGAPAVVDSVTSLAGVYAKDAALAPAVSYLEAVFKDEGLDIARALGQAAEESDARFIDRAYLVEKLGEAKAATIIQVATDSINYVAAHTQETLNQTFAAAGGEEALRNAAGIFNQSADPAERKMIAEMLDSGDREKMIYAAKRVAQFAAQAGGGIAHVPAALGQPGAVKGLSQAEYIKAISVRNLPDAQYEQLKQARQLGKSQGL